MGIVGSFTFMVYRMRLEPFTDTNFLNFQKRNLAEHMRSSHEFFHSLVKYLVILLGLLVYLRGILAAKQTGFLKFLQNILNCRRRRLKQMWARAVVVAGGGLRGCRSSALVLLITAASQTGTIIHHKATQRRLRVNC